MYWGDSALVSQDQEMMTFAVIIASLLVLVYAARICHIAYLFREDKPVRSNTALSNVTVLIPARNEAANILACLASIRDQDLDSAHIEVIVIDDFSEDDTLNIASVFQSEFKLKVIRNKAPGKKQALQTGIEAAENNLILTTDADCIMSKTWISSMMNHFTTHDLNMLCGLIQFRASNMFEQLQQAESAAIVGVSAVMLNAEKPCTCNGANLMFRKDVFERVGGYDTHAGLLSGDDDLLMQEFALLNIEKTKYLIHSSGIVHTASASDFKALLQQRSRWLSKRKAYKFRYNESLQLLVVLHLVAFYFLYFLLFVKSPYTLDILITIAVKYAADLYYALKLRKVIRFKLVMIFLMPFYQVYIFVVLLYNRINKTEWKGRVVNTK